MASATGGGARLDPEIIRALRLFAAGMAGLALLALARPAPAHEAAATASQPLGWSYPWACCSGQDCRQASSGAGGEVRETAAGYLIAATGEVVPYRDRRIRLSPDGAFHWCAHKAGIDAGRTICLFVPPRGF